MIFKNHLIKYACYKFIIVLLFIFISYDASEATTYYIDYENGSDKYSGVSKSGPWKLCPGMVGFNGTYFHSPGDEFIFKGGVTWPASVLPLTLGYSGTDGKIDLFTSDSTWFDGSTWTEPVFDAEHSLSESYESIIITNYQHHFKISNLKLINVGYPGISNNARAIMSNFSYEFEICYNTIIAYSNHAIVGASQGTVPRNGFRIHHNEISNAGNSIEWRTDNSGGSSAITGFEIYNNIIHDAHSNITGSDHADGIHIFSVSNHKQLKNAKIYNNFFYGDWSVSSASAGGTSQIFIEDCADGLLIYNNVLSFSNTSSGSSHQTYTFSPGLISIYGSNNVGIYNNTILSNSSSLDNNAAMSSIRIANTSSNVTIKNNICSLSYQGIDAQGVVGLNISNNLIFTRSNNIYGKIGTKYSYSISTWNNNLEVGKDYEGNPDISSAYSSPPDFSLSFESTARGVGAVLSSIFDYDIKGNFRGTEWDIGAYEYDGQSMASSVVAPSNLKIINSE